MFCNLKKNGCLKAIAAIIIVIVIIVVVYKKQTEPFDNSLNIKTKTDKKNKKCSQDSINKAYREYLLNTPGKFMLG